LSLNSPRLCRKSIKSGIKKPMIMLTGMDDEKTDIAAMEAGASDYLVKGRFDSDSLERSIRYSIQQKMVENELEQKNNTLKSFNHMVAHDLKNPLGVMIGFLDLMESDIGEKLSENSRKYFDRIVSSTDRMLKLVEGFLAYADSGGEIVQEHLSLENVLTAGLDSLDNVISERGVRIEKTIRADNFLGDKTMITQVFQNLIGNAIKYCPPERNPLIHIFSEEIDAGRILQLKIKDNGIGIKKEKIEDMFQVFKRVHDPRFKAQGSGIGLATVKRIIESHRGMLRVESEFGEGTTFIITLPLQSS
ncbi:ATP-binding protein, partial [Candidatus Riflebacteria bacterium]